MFLLWSRQLLPCGDRTPTSGLPNPEGRSSPTNTHVYPLVLSCTDFFVVAYIISSVQAVLSALSWGSSSTCVWSCVPDGHEYISTSTISISQILTIRNKTAMNIHVCRMWVSNQRTPGSEPFMETNGNPTKSIKTVSQGYISCWLNLLFYSEHRDCGEAHNSSPYPPEPRTSKRELRS